MLHNKEGLDNKWSIANITMLKWIYGQIRKNRLSSEYIRGAVGVAWRTK